MGVKVKPEQLLDTVPQTAGEAYRMIGLKNSMPAANEIQFNPEHTPFKFQLSPVAQLIKHTRYGLFDETGVGKTLPCQLFLLLNCCLGGKSMAVMPPNLIDQFAESYSETFIGLENHFSIERMPRGPQIREARIEAWNKTGWPDFLLLSYQMFLKTWQVIRNKGYGAVAADEAHALKSPSSKVHKAFQHFIGTEGKTHTLLMTGTPGHNTLVDYYGLIKIINPKAYTNKRAFERAHVEQIKVNGFWKTIGYQNRKLLSQNLYARGRRVRKEQVYDMEYPSVSEVPVRLNRNHMSLYRKLVKERVLELGDEIIDATNPSSLRQKSLQIVTNPHLFSEQTITNEVHNTLDELLDGINLRSEKVVVVANFQDTVDALAKRYAKYKPALAYGKSNTEKARKQFLHDKDCRMLILHPKSGGAGLNLQSVARYVIFAEPCSVPGDFKQAMDRVHRPGQDKHVTVYIIKAVGTIAPKLTEDMLAKDHEVKGIQRDKTSINDALFGGTRKSQEMAVAA